MYFSYMDAYQPFLKTAVDAARAAGRLALSMQHSLKEIRFKGEKDVVTEADLACDAAIRKILTAAHPDHGIVTEEAEALRQGGEFTWFVDPIDGTINFSRSFPLWGISVGLRQGADMVAGAIYLPATDEMFTATRGGGAFLNGNRIHVSSVTKLDQGILSHGDFNVGNTPEERHSMNQRLLAARSRAAGSLQRVKCLGSAVVESSYVASGRMEAYCMMAMKPWDVAVGSLLVTEAGGKVTRADGTPFSVEGPDALFSNGALHELVLDALGTRKI
jgi:myo-inositol-1(or 4)-monophosphatase